MTLLNRYVLAAFGRIFGLSLASFIGVYLLVDFFEKLDDFMEHQAALSHYLLYFLNKIPIIAAQVVPLAVLMGVFLTLGGLNRTHELTAIRAGGISLPRINLPLLGVALGISLTVLLANEFLLPLSARKVHFILRSEVKGKQELVMKRDRLWLREGNQILNVRLAFPEKGELQGLTVFQVGPDFRLLSRTAASRAVWGEEGWTLQQGITWQFDPETGRIAATEPFARKRVALAKKPEDFQQVEWRQEELGFRELRTLTRKLKEEGYDATRFQVDMHSRLALPFANLVMAFLGIPFALQKGRGASISLGVALTLVIGIAYHLLQALLTSFGYAGVLPPLVAAWSAHLLFSFIALWLLLAGRE